MVCFVLHYCLKFQHEIDFKGLQRLVLLEEMVALVLFYFLRVGSFVCLFNVLLSSERCRVSSCVVFLLFSRSRTLCFFVQNDIKKQVLFVLQFSFFSK